jgi:Holliday junction resolvasome RuvABC endonuclease subunit
LIITTIGITLFTINKKIKLIYSILNYTLTILITTITIAIIVIKIGNNYQEAYFTDINNTVALVDLSFLNSALRMTLVNNKIPFTIVSPTSLKKFACANGQAEKEVMIDAWKRMDKNIAKITDIKIDDLADSYFLSCYPKEI